MKISNIHARQILDSRGNPTVEADVYIGNTLYGRASVPSGASTGSREALELRDGAREYLGKGVLTAVANVNSVIAPEIIGISVEDQEAIDKKMILMDSTDNKSKLGANAILAVSLAVAHAASCGQKMKLFEWVHLMSENQENLKLPTPMLNVVNGGIHANFVTDIQEFMIVPQNTHNFSDTIQKSAVVFHTLKNLLKEKGYEIAVGDEGGFSPRFKNGNTEAFQVLIEAIEKAGFQMRTDFLLAIDAAASEIYKNNLYNLNADGKELSSAEMVLWLKALSGKYPLFSIEDGLAESDWQGWANLTSQLGKEIKVVGDDLLVTNVDLLKKAISEKAANAILIKPNQIGTLTETIAAVKMAKEVGWVTIMSHRSGETEDTTIAHLAVGLSTEFIKTGSLSRSERVAKYNELLRIEEYLSMKV